MLLRHSGAYFLARGLAGAISFLSIAVYTRLLPPADYGRYALVIASVGFFNMVFFQWLRLSLLRFLPAHLDDPRPLLSTAFGVFGILCALTGVLAIPIAFLFPTESWKSLIFWAVPLLWGEAWFELNLELARCQLQPLRYGLMSIVRASTALLLGVIAVRARLGAAGPIAGLLVGSVLSALFFGLSYWRGVWPRVQLHILPVLLRYGLPLTAGFVLNFVVSSSDRFLIAWFLGDAAAGRYAAAYDLAQQPITLLMVVVNLAGYPLAVRALELDGYAAAQEQVRRNGSLLFAVGLPAAAGIALLAPAIVGVFLGAQFREDAARLLPWVAAAVFLAGLRAYHFDLAFQLGRHTTRQVWVAGIAATANFLLNLWWIPLWGLMGAVYATLVGYVLGLVASFLLGRSVFRIGIPTMDWLKTFLACFAMVAVIWCLPQREGLTHLIISIVVGMMTYLIGVLLLDVGSWRTSFLRRFL